MIREYSRAVVGVVVALLLVVAVWVLRGGTGPDAVFGDLLAAEGGVRGLFPVTGAQIALVAVAGVALVALGILLRRGRAKDRDGE